MENTRRNRLKTVKETKQKSRNEIAKQPIQETNIGVKETSNKHKKFYSVSYYALFSVFQIILKC